MPQASRRVVVVGAFLFSSATTPRTQKGQPVHTRSLPQLHSYRGRRGASMRLCLGSWCLAIELAGADQRDARVGVQPEPTFAIARDAVSNPTTHTTHPGGVAERFKAPVSTTGTREGLEGSFPSSTTEHSSGAPLLNSDRVVQRRRAGRRRHNRPAPPSPHAQHAAVGRWLRRCSAELLRHGLDSFDSICWGPSRALSFSFGDGVFSTQRERVPQRPPGTS